MGAVTLRQRPGRPGARRAHTEARVPDVTPAPAALRVGRTLALLVLACLLPAWLAVGALDLEARRRDAAAREGHVLGVAQALRRQVERAPGGWRQQALADASAAGLPAVPARPGWSGAVQDLQGAAWLATPGFERLRGAPLAAVARAAAGRDDDGFVHARTEAGVPVVLAYSRLDGGDAVAVASATEQALLDEGPQRLSPLLAAVGLVQVAAAAAAAWLLRRQARASRGLVEAAAAGAAAVRLLHVRTQERDEALLAQAEASREARRDPLTRLANRTAFLQRLQACIRERREHGGPLVVLFIDLDDFKAVNDRWGHVVGDTLLCAFATRLVGGVREGDLPARLSGDEFAVVLDGLTLAEAEPVAQGLLDRLSQPYGLGARSLQVTASIGMAAFPDDAGDAAALLEAADAAMYAAKGAGKGHYRSSGWDALGPAAPVAQGPAGAA